MKLCARCNTDKPLDHFRVVKATGKHHSWCQKCESSYHKERRSTQLTVIEEPSIVDPKEAKELAMKRMLSSAKQRAKDKGLLFNIHYEDVSIPNLCPVLKIPLIPSTDGNMSDNSPSLDRLIPYLGYTKGNVKVVSMKANRIKTDATSAEIEAVLEYVKEIEQENT